MMDVEFYWGHTSLPDLICVMAWLTPTKRRLVVRIGSRAPVFHIVPPRRDLNRVDYFGTRQTPSCLLFKERRRPLQLATARWDSRDGRRSLPGLLIASH